MKVIELFLIRSVLFLFKVIDIIDKVHKIIRSPMASEAVNKLKTMAGLAPPSNESFDNLIEDLSYQPTQDSSFMDSAIITQGKELPSSTYEPYGSFDKVSDKEALSIFHNELGSRGIAPTPQLDDVIIRKLKSGAINDAYTYIPIFVDGIVAARMTSLDAEMKTAITNLTTQVNKMAKVSLEFPSAVEKIVEASEKRIMAGRIQTASIQPTVTPDMEMIKTEFLRALKFPAVAIAHSELRARLHLKISEQTMRAIATGSTSNELKKRVQETVTGILRDIQSGKATTQAASPGTSTSASSN
ncbi:TPA_asm: P [Begonia betacytorhabdovirus 1]|nr:TPA_asm: P [Begonia betacytorhabdovirus 1]